LGGGLLTGEIGERNLTKEEINLLHGFAVLKECNYAKEASEIILARRGGGEG